MRTETPFAIVDNPKLQYLFLLIWPCSPHFPLRRISKSETEFRQWTLYQLHCTVVKLHCKSHRFWSIYPSPDWYVSRIGFIHFRPPELNWKPVISVKWFYWTFPSLSLQIQFKQNIFSGYRTIKTVHRKRKFPKYNVWSQGNPKRKDFHLAFRFLVCYVVSRTNLSPCHQAVDEPRLSRVGKTP